MKHLVRTFLSLPAPPEAEREGCPARGIIIAVLLGLAMWAGLIALVVSFLW